MFTSSSEFQKVPGLQKAEITTEEHLEKKKKTQQVIDLEI